MARTPAARASQAADGVMAWLKTQEAKPRPQGPASVRQDQPSGGRRPADGEGTAASDAGNTVRSVSRQPRAEERRPALAPAHTDWLYHRLLVSGPADQVGTFRSAAAGAGIIPWHLDLDRMEEDFFLRLAAPPGHARALSLDGARLLAAELRDAVARRHALGVARIGRSSACAFDLHALVPVPETILRLGPDHPDGLDWLAAHWGTTEALRHVTVEAGVATRRRSVPGEAVFAVSFWSADWTPWPALAAVREQWPVLRLEVMPRYELE